MNEWLMDFAMVWCVGLFAAGGTHIEGVGGQKWLRRYLLPAGLAIIALLSHVLWWQCLGLATTLMVVLSLGYGSKTPYWVKSLVFLCYGLAFLWIGWSWWVVITGPLCLALFVFSNLRLTRGSFHWRICEGGMGFLLSAGFIAAMVNQWR